LNKLLSALKICFVCKAILAINYVTCLGPKDPLANAMAEMMNRIKSGNIQLKPVRTVSMDFIFVVLNSNVLV